MVKATLEAIRLAAAVLESFHMNDALSKAASIMGRKGGKANIDKHDSKHRKTVASQGGKALLEKRGPDYFAKLAKKSAAARVRNKKAKEAAEKKAKKSPTHLSPPASG